MAKATATSSQEASNRVGGKFPKGASGNPRGRPKGSPNKVPSDIRKMVLEALDKSGGVDYLCLAARKNPQAFLGLVSKCLPKEIKAEVTMTTLEDLVCRAREIERLRAPGSN